MSGILDDEADQTEVVIGADGEVAPQPERRPVSVADLQRALNKANQEKDALRARADASERTANAARRTAADAIEQRYESEVANVKARLQTARAALAASEEAEEAADVADDRAALRRAQRATNRLDREVEELEKQDKYLSDNKDALLANARAQAQPRADEWSYDPTSYTATQRRWITQHPEYLSDPDFRAKVAQAHQFAVLQGIPIDSDRYYQIVDAAAGQLSRATVQDEDDDAEDGGVMDGLPAPRRDHADEQLERRAIMRPARQSPVMPVGRSGDRSQSQRGNANVTLTAEEREAADISLSHLPTQATMRDGVRHPSRYEVYAQGRNRRS